MGFFHNSLIILKFMITGEKSLKMKWNTLLPEISNTTAIYLRGMKTDVQNFSGAELIIPHPTTHQPWALLLVKKSLPQHLYAQRHSLLLLATERPFPPPDKQVSPHLCVRVRVNKKHVEKRQIKSQSYGESFRSATCVGISLTHWLNPAWDSEIAPDRYAWCECVSEGESRCVCD